MCGIIGYIGTRQAAPLLVEGLKALEYRGYDSAGVATVGPGAYFAAPQLHCSKSVGKIANLEQRLTQVRCLGTAGIGHTRWATHGEPSERNAHPHTSGGDIPWPYLAVVHNGIIENHDTLRAELGGEGFVFQSDTDTEVLPHLIDREFRRGANSLEQAVNKALARVEGAYAVAVVSERYPDEVVAACNSSPLVVGLGEQELYLASDELALAGKVSGVVHVRDGELVVLRRNGHYEFKGIPLEQVVERIESPTLAETVQKGGHAHFMHKEVHEQPQSMCNVLAGRLRADGAVTFGGLTGDIEARLAETRQITLVGCGTSLFAAEAGRLFIERLSGVSCVAEQAAEFAYREPQLSSAQTVIGISQSGETADTLRAIALAKERHALCLSITNRVGSTLAKRTRLGMYLHAGPEIAVASTKAFTAQAALLLLFAVRLAHLRGRSVPEQLLRSIGLLPELLKESLEQEERIKEVAAACATQSRVIVIARGHGVPLALEAALKIREIAYLDAHGLSAAELKHGTLALVEQGTPVVALLPNGVLGEKMRSNLEEVRTRGGRVIAFEPPAYVPDELVPIVLAPQIQLLAYHLGLARGVDVDQPRNLAKAVTVE